jgi:hypothetical protein
MKKNYFNVLCICFAMILSFANSFAQYSVLYIRQNPGTGTYASDGQFNDSLASWGFKVKFINQSGFISQIGGN